MPMNLFAPLLGFASAAAGPASLAVQLLLAVYAFHRWLLLARWWRSRGTGDPTPPPPAEWPVVTVQLPVYNEPAVTERLIDAACVLHYPPGKLEIQLLDDSSDETTSLAACAVARHRARGVDVRVLRREHRDGFKAGALAAGLEAARGELLAVFDADFVPPPDFLERLVPHFGARDVGMVQARWAHLNRDRSWITEAQAVMIDAHFMVEHATRMRGGLFFNFNGAAGVWRRACIESAGGWAHDTLTEDLDLSYRAQLAGWRFTFVSEVAAPAELPADVRALKSQQRRWVRGSIQTARKLLPSLLSAPLPGRVKTEAVLHLTGNAVYPLLLAASLSLLPALLTSSTWPPVLAAALQGTTLMFGFLPVLLFLGLGQRLIGVPAPRAVAGVLAALLLGAGLSAHNAGAVLEGLRGAPGEWERTPKTGDGGPGPRCATPAARARFGRLEVALALYLAGAALVAVAQAQYRALPFLVVLLAGFAAVGGATLSAQRRARAA